LIPNSQPVGLLLAGGPGLRIGGDKANVALCGQPLLHYALGAMKRALHDVAVIAKADVVLPQLDGAMVWIEPDEPVHPMLGICEALALAGGRPVLVCPVDMPFVTPELLAALAAADATGRPAVVVACHGTPRPLLGRYQPTAAPRLLQAARNGVPVADASRALDPALLQIEDETELFDVDTPDDLLQASAMLGVQRRSRLAL